MTAGGGGEHIDHPLVLSQAVDQDVDQATQHFEAIDWYEGTALVERFLAAARDALQYLSRYPAMGSPRFQASVTSPQLQGLRFHRLKAFPYAFFYVFYQGHPQHIEVIRLLHMNADIATHLNQTSGLGGDDDITPLY